MSAALNPQPPEPPPPAPPATDPEAEFQRKTLHDLTDWCAAIAYCLRNAVEMAESNDDVIRLAAAFDTAARNVRRTIMLARTVAKPPRPAPASPAPARPQNPARHLRLAETPDRDTPDRLDTPDPAPDDRPIADQIAEIRRDLEPALAACPAHASPPTAPPPGRNPDPPPSPPTQPPRAPRAADHPPTPDG